MRRIVQPLGQVRVEARELVRHRHVPGRPGLVPGGAGREHHMPVRNSAAHDALQVLDGVVGETIDIQVVGDEVQLAGGLEAPRALELGVRRLGGLDRSARPLVEDVGAHRAVNRARSGSVNQHVHAAIGVEISGARRELVRCLISQRIGLDSLRAAAAHHDNMRVLRYAMQSDIRPHHTENLFEGVAPRPAREVDAAA